MRNRVLIGVTAALFSTATSAFAEHLEPNEDEAAILEVATWYWILCGTGGLEEDAQDDSAEADTLIEHIIQGLAERFREITETQISKHVQLQMADDHEHIRALFASVSDEEFGITIKPSALKIAYPSDYEGGVQRSGTVDCMTGLSEEEFQELRDNWGVFQLRSTQIDSLPFPIAWMRFDIAFTPEEVPYTDAIESSSQLFRQRRWLSLVKRGKWVIADDFRGAIPPASDDDSIFQTITTMQFKAAAELEDIAFVYGYEGATAVALPDGSNALKTYLKEFSLARPVDMPRHFAPPEDERMRNRAIELVQPNIGDSYCVVFTNPATAETLSFANIGFMPDGGGGVSGFVGILENPEEPVQNEWLRPIGIALHREECDFETDELSIPENARESLKTFAKDELLADRLNRVTPFYIDRPNRMGALLNLTFADRDVLIGAFQNEHGAWTPIPFPTPVVPDANGFVLENPDGANDVAPYDSAVYVMPDVDHNGANELFIQSTVSFLFTLTFNEAGTPNGFKIVNSAYVGP